MEGFAGDASKVTASGPGLEPEGVVVQRPTHFHIYAQGRYSIDYNNCNLWYLFKKILSNQNLGQTRSLRQSRTMLPKNSNRILPA